MSNTQFVNPKKGSRIRSVSKKKVTGVSFIEEHLNKIEELGLNRSAVVQRGIEMFLKDYDRGDINNNSLIKTVFPHITKGSLSIECSVVARSIKNAITDPKYRLDTTNFEGYNDAIAYLMAHPKKEEIFNTQIQYASSFLAEYSSIFVSVSIVEFLSLDMENKTKQLAIRAYDNLDRHLDSYLISTLQWNSYLRFAITYSLSLDFCQEIETRFNEIRNTALMKAETTRDRLQGTWLAAESDP